MVLTKDEISTRQNVQPYSLMASEPISNTFTGRIRECLPNATGGYSMNQYGDTHVATGAQLHQGDRHYHFEQDPLKEEIKGMLEELSFPKVHSRFDSIADAAGGTYQWILDPDVKPGDYSNDRQRCLAGFSPWYFHGSGIFWISGKPGSGKSTLAKHLLQNTISRSTFKSNPVQSSSFAFFFWLNGTPLQRSLSGCMRSLLCQLLQNGKTSSFAASTLRPLKSKRYCWTEIQLREAVCTVLRQAQIPIVMFLDGLDECENPRDCLRFLDALDSIRNLKICVSSRPEQIFVDEFEGRPSIKLQDVNRYDIAKMVQERFSKDPQVQRMAKRYSQNSLHKLAETIVDKAEGVFLWAHLVVKDVLEGISSRDDVLTLQRRVQRMPGDMLQLYKSMLKRHYSTNTIHDSQAALYFRMLLKHNQYGEDYNLLTFTFMIDDRLRKRFLISATAPPHTRPTAAEIDPEVIEAWINTRTCGLLYVTAPPRTAAPKDNFERLQSSQVNFIHRTAADFFKDGEVYKLLKPCTLSEEQIMDIIFDARLVELIIVPYLHKQYVSSQLVKYLFMKSTNMLSCSLFDTTIKGLWSGLAESGSVILGYKYRHRYRPFKETHTTATLPSSKYAAPDFAQILADAGCFRCLKKWLDVYSCWHDIDYISSLLAPVLSGIARWIKAPPGFGDSEMISEGWLLWDRLIESGADMCRRQCDGYGDFYYPLFHMIVDLNDLDYLSILYNPELSSFNNRVGDLVSSSSLPSCHEIWFGPSIRQAVGEADLLYWGNSTVNDVVGGMPLAQGRNIVHWPVHSGRIKVAVVVRKFDAQGFNIQAYTMYHVTETESERLLRKMKQGQELCFWESDIFRLESFYLPSEDALRCCPIIISFEAAMRILGVSRKMIRKFYEQEALRMEKEDASVKNG